MKLTDEQFELLKKYEAQFRTAVNAKWANNPGTAALNQIHNVMVQLTGRNVRLNTSCSTCVLRLLTDMGTIYFADKAKRESRVTTIQETAETKTKVEIKTDKPKRGRKPKS